LYRAFRERPLRARAVHRWGPAVRTQLWSNLMDCVGDFEPREGARSLACFSFTAIVGYSTWRIRASACWFGDHATVGKTKRKPKPPYPDCLSICEGRGPWRRHSRRQGPRPSQIERQSVYTDCRPPSAYGSGPQRPYSKCPIETGSLSFPNPKLAPKCRGQASTPAHFRRSVPGVPPSPPSRVMPLPSSAPLACSMHSAQRAFKLVVEEPFRTGSIFGLPVVGLQCRPAHDPMHILPIRWFWR
jgi:hypothetical protein